MSALKGGVLSLYGTAVGRLYRQLLRSRADSKRGLHEALSRMPAGRRKSCTQVSPIFSRDAVPGRVCSTRECLVSLYVEIAGQGLSLRTVGWIPKRKLEGREKPTNREVHPTRGRKEWEALNFRMSTIRVPHDCHNLAGHTTAF